VTTQKQEYKQQDNRRQDNRPPYKEKRVNKFLSVPSENNLPYRIIIMRKKEETTVATVENIKKIL